MVRFGMKTEPNQTKLFVIFKITELNQTVCISNWTELFQSELNRTTIIYNVEKKIQKQTKSNFSYRTELNCFELNRTILNWTKPFWTKLNYFSSVSELLVMIQFYFILVQFSFLFFFPPLSFGPLLSTTLSLTHVTSHLIPLRTPKSFLQLHHLSYNSK